jgi:hypothetical protein
MSTLKFPKDLSGKLIDTLCKRLELGNDTQFAEFVGIHATKISRVRNGLEGFSKGNILDIHERTDLPVKEIRRLMKRA